MSLAESDPWNTCSGSLPAVSDAGRKLNKSVESFVNACNSGNSFAAGQALERLRTEVEILLSAVDATCNAIPPTGTVDQFALEIESLALSTSDLTPVVRSGHRVLVGPVVVRIQRTNHGEMGTLVGHTIIRTARPQTVIDEVIRQSKEKFDHKRVTKVLKEAFNMHVSIKGTDPASAIVSLEELRKMISMARDGSQYSPEELTNDIQMLATVHKAEMLESGIRFVPVPAARVQYELMMDNGNIVNLGALQMVDPAKALA